MKHFYLRMTALSPLAIRADQAEGGVATTNAIPGATLLGSLAAAHRMLYPEREDEFARFFLTEQIHFPYLYPANFKSDMFHNANLPVMPLPRTAQTCKRFSGFQPVVDEEGSEERHGVYDSLLDWGTFALLENKHRHNKEQIAIATLHAPLRRYEQCGYAQGKYSHASCQQTMQPISGYYRRHRSKLHLRMQANKETRLQTRTGINRAWGVVEESILYNREVFDEGSRFWGEIRIPDELVDTFQAFVKDAREENIICIGTGRTRGLGHVSIELNERPASQVRDFNSKIAWFDEAMQDRTREANIEQGNTFYFAITLQSPTILRDPYLRYQQTVDVTTLSDLLKPASSAYTFILLYQSVGMRRVAGWNELWGTPRASDYAIEPGSTFLYVCTPTPDDKFKRLLQAIEEEGIGLRRAEGFGRISISDPFHLERDSKHE